MSTANMQRARHNLPADCPVDTPWGMADSCEVLAPGIYFVGTPSHGGIKLFPDRQAVIPDVFKQENGWYEEDSDYAIVYYFFREFFGEEKYESAVRTLKNWHWREFEQHTGTVIDPAESYTKRQHLFEEANKNKWVVVAAFGDWHEKVPQGKVGVVATKGGIRGNGHTRPEERYFLVSQEVYQNREVSCVVDDVAHEDWCGPKA